MHAITYQGPKNILFEEKPKPKIQNPTDCIVKMTLTTICGTDLHIWKGDVPEVERGRILGHEGVGVIEEVGSAVSQFRVHDKVLISCITSCGKCPFCRKSMYSHCETGGWLLGHTIDGVQAEYVRIPHADTSLYHIPAGVDEEAMVMFSDVLPTGFEVGVLRGRIQLGDTVAIVGSGPIGLSALLTAQFYAPSEIIVVDTDDDRLQAAKRFGATKVINSSSSNAVQQILEYTQKRGVNVAIEAVGIPETFDICQSVIAPGGYIANIGVHGTGVNLQLERLWHENITITTALVDTFSIPLLLKIFKAGKLKPAQMITHRFSFREALKAYDVFKEAKKHRALKVVLKTES